MNPPSNLAGATDFKQLYQSILDSMTDGVYLTDRHRRITYWNEAAERLTGFGAGDVIGRRCADGILCHCDSESRVLCGSGCPLKAVMKDGTPRQAHVFMHHAKGHRVPVHVRGAPVYDEQGRITGAVEVFSDDTERQSALDRLQLLEQRSMTDELTGLANRRRLNESLHGLLAACQRRAEPFGFLLLDVDHFKQFNDRHGHLIGDQVLIMVANTIGHCCRAYDLPVRWGGEEFAVLCPHVDADALRSLAERFRLMVASASLRRCELDLRVTVSLGATLARHGDTPDTITARADEALYHSKQDGRNKVSIH